MAETSPAPKALSFLDYWKGTQAYALLLQFKAEGRSIFTTHSEAEARAKICVACPKHVAPDKIKDAGWLEKWARGKLRKQIENRFTTSDNLLGQCGVCKCENRTLVHLHSSLLKVQPDEKGYPATCWKTKF